MRFHLSALAYWPIWLGFKAIGHTYLGMLIGSVISLGLMLYFWVREFGWKWHV